MLRFDARWLLIPLAGLPVLVFALARTATRAAAMAPPATGVWAGEPAAGGEAASTGAGRGAQASHEKTGDAKAGASCPARALLIRYEVDSNGRTWRVPVWEYGNYEAISFTSGMTIDADGAPNAYNPQNTGLDNLSNAGTPGRWVGILQDKDGNGVVQGPGDPYPGYYVSCTSLEDFRKPQRSPARFVDSRKIPYIVLPGMLARQARARVGDFAVVENIRNGKRSFAIFADVGSLGEGSIALAKRLGIDPNARTGGTWWGVQYLVFPGSGDRRPKSVRQINRAGKKLLKQWGGAPALSQCARKAPRPPLPPFGAFGRGEQPGPR